MAIIAGPTDVDGINTASAQNCGPFPDSATPGAIAAVLQGFLVDQAFAKSPNAQGTSWAETDLSVTSFFAYNWLDAPRNRVVSVSIELDASRVSDIIALYAIDLDTGVLTAISTLTQAHVLNSAVCAVLPDTSIVVVVNSFDAGTGLMLYRYNGAWSGPTDLTDTGTFPHIPYPLDIDVDGSGAVYVAYELLNGASTSENVRVQTVDTSNNLGPVSTVANLGSTDTQTTMGRRLRLFGGQLWMAITSASASFVGAYRSGPAGNLVFPASSPVTFTQSFSASPPVGTAFAGAGLAGSSSLFLVWSAQAGPLGSITSDAIQYSLWSGSGDSWAGAVTAFDWVTNPPIGSGALPYPAQHSHLWCTQQLPNGTLGTFCDFFDGNGDCFCWYTNWGAAVAPSVGGFSGGAGAGRFKCCAEGHTFQAARMAESLRQSVQRKSAWPYEHVFPPPGSEVVEVFGSAPTLAAGTLTSILTYLVPAGLRFFLTALLFDFLGASFNPGDALWTVDENFTVPSLQGSYVEGLIQWPVPAGSFAKGRRWKLPRAYEFAPLSVLRSTAVNVNLGVGAPNTYVSGVFGYLVPSTKG